MRRIILYIATSIDGYIATQDGGVEWLEEIPNPHKTDYGTLPPAYLRHSTILRSEKSGNSSLK